jgi:DNA-binding IclR family transcriptional regulator
VPGLGYVLGSKLIELGYLAREQLPLTTITRPHLEDLAERTQDTVHLGLSEGADVFYLDKLPAKRGLEMRSRIGFRMPLAFTGVGKALMLDMAEDRWRDLYESGRRWHAERGTAPATFPSLDDFLARMRSYVAQSCAFDLEENEAGVRCVAAPIRDASGGIVAAISVASAIQYMPLERLPQLGPLVMDTATAISRELGWRDRAAVPGFSEIRARR